MENNNPNSPTLFRPDTIITSQGAIIGIPQVDEQEQNSLIEPVFMTGSSEPITLHDLETKCIVPSWADSTVCISHGTFIRSVAQAAADVFSADSIEDIQIRVQSPQHGRIPSAIHKKTSELLDSDKTLYYQKCLFCIVLKLKNHINNTETRIVLGGVRVYEPNLYSKRSAEHFKVYIGDRVKICENMCIFGTNFIDRLEAMSAEDIYEASVRLFSSFDPQESQQKLESLGSVRLSQCQWTKIIGNLRLYEALSIQEKRDLGIENLCTLGDAAINAATRGYVNNPVFGRKADGTISVWDMLNLLNESCKSMVLDRFIDRITNAVDFCFGIKEALLGEDNQYTWFLTA